MTAPQINLNRTRRNVLAAVKAGRVFANERGEIYLAIRNSYKHRCDKNILLFAAAGWVVLGDDRCTYELTAAGQAALDGAP